MRVRGREEGAGTALAVAVVAAVLTLFGMLASVAVVAEARHRVAAAADAAALAAGDTALGVLEGVPCERAQQVARVAAVALEACAQRGDLVRVRTATAVLGFTVRADAVAGPPPAAG